MDFGCQKCCGNFTMRKTIIYVLSREIKSSQILSDSQVLRNLVRSHARHLEIADFSTTFTYLLLFFTNIQFRFIFRMVNVRAHSIAKQILSLIYYIKKKKKKKALMRIYSLKTFYSNPKTKGRRQFQGFEISEMNSIQRFSLTRRLSSVESYLRHLCGGAFRVGVKDEGDWFYSQEWWDPHERGHTVSQSSSSRGNGLVSVVAHPSSLPVSIPCGVSSIALDDF